MKTKQGETMSEIRLLDSEALQALRHGEVPTDLQLSEGFNFAVNIVNREDALLALDAYNEFGKAVINGEKSRKNREWAIFMCLRRSAEDRMLRFQDAK
jgi:hypothetical protein